MPSPRENAIGDLLKRVRNEGRINLQDYAPANHVLSIYEIAEVLSQETMRHGGSKYYLNKQFSTKEKCLSVLKNFAFVIERAPHHALDAVLSSGLDLYVFTADNINYRIIFTITREFHHEGEWSLELMANDESLFLLAFTVVPAAFVGASGKDVMLISRMQGRPGRFPKIRAATRAMGDITPQSALYCAARGLARAMEIAHIAGLSAELQPSCHGKNLAAFRETYDAFFIANGAASFANGFYILNVLLPSKPLDQVDANRRRRSKRKRQRKEQIAASALQSWRRDVADTDSSNGEALAQLKDPAFQDCIVKLIERSHSIREGEAMLAKLSRHIITRHNLFDRQWYLDQNPDVAAAGMDPIAHYIEFGAREGRNPNRAFITRNYQAQNSETLGATINPLVHFCLNDAARPQGEE